MVQYKHLHSLLTIDGKKILVDLRRWGERTLSGETLDTFEADLFEIRQLADQLLESGELKVDTITKTFTTSLGTTLDVPIGVIYTFQTEKPQIEKYDYWHSQFAADPNVTYQPLTLQG